VRVSYGIGKRRPELPIAASGIIGEATKADLMEAAWHLASLANAAGSSDDHYSTRARLIQEINLCRQRRGARPLKAT